MTANGIVLKINSWIIVPKYLVTRQRNISFLGSCMHRCDISCKYDL